MSEPPMIAYASVGDVSVQTFRRRLLRSMLRGSLASILAIALLVAFVGLFQLFHLGPLTAGMGMITCAIVTTIAAGSIRAARRQRAITILTYCEQGIRLAMPLPEFLSAVAMNESRRMSRRLHAIVRTLLSPASLSDALDGELVELPRRVRELLRTAEVNGTLGPTLRRLLDESPTRSPETDDPAVMPLAYVAVMAAFITIPIVMIAIFVMPKFAEIFRDFGAPAPWTWKFFAVLSEPVMLTVGLVTIAIGFMLLLSVLKRNARWIFFRRAEADRPLKQYSDRLLRLVPFAGRQIGDRDWADVCQVIAEGLDQQRPLDAVLREATSPHLNVATIERLDRWGAHLRAGDGLSGAARAAGVPTLVSGLIGNSGIASDTLAPTFAFLARHYRGRVASRGAWLRAAVMPVVTIIAGACVLFVALLIWTPLCALIDATLPYPLRL